MKTIAILGAGQIGAMAAALLLHSGDYRVRIYDRSAAALGRLGTGPGLDPQVLDIEDSAAVQAAIGNAWAVLSAAPWHLTAGIARAACAAGVHYLDLTEDVASTRLVRSLAEEARAALIPQCGLAPGFVSIVGHDLACRFDMLDSLRLRVGALPQFPSNALGYNLTWSTAGVINEYLRPCDAIANGQPVSVPALEELEHFSLEGVAYEAFNTSGGLGTLGDSLQGRVRSLNYRTIRYPGHRDVMKLLLQDLRLGERPELLQDILEQALPATDQDVVVIFVTATGLRDGRRWQETYANRIHACEAWGRTWTAIQLTTAASACAVLDLLRAGRIPTRGFVRQEQIALPDFLANRFGRIYAPDGAMGLERLGSAAPVAA